MLGFQHDRVHHGGRGMGAKAIISSCRYPLVHPWLSLKTLETFGLGLQGSVPLQDRKKVAYFSRSHGGTANGGRRVMNEDEMLGTIRALLAERNQGEALVRFHELRFGSRKELMEWFHCDVRAVIGPHGSAMLDHRWPVSSQYSAVPR